MNTVWVVTEVDGTDMQTMEFQTVASTREIAEAYVEGRYEDRLSLRWDAPETPWYRTDDASWAEIGCQREVWIEQEEVR